ncbi:MAG: GNAT family N-acetyltransferase [Deltaproteobacteria bacterium]|nr:GNAT family N-acetyltransferase [Deltaproteobacteria bacterium]MBW2122403.1 GNAT family N-acetyltransferase [Deltaproteobacteria bacterium]
MLAGRRVNLRRIEKADLWQLWSWHEERDLYLFLKIRPFVSYDQLNERFAEYFAWKGDFLIENDAGRALGVCSYQPVAWKNRFCELGLQICESDPDQVYALDTLSTLLGFLFGEMNLSRVQAFVAEFACHEISAFEKAGFLLEGRLREHLFREGMYRDLLIYAMLREDFGNTPAGRWQV